MSTIDQLLSHKSIRKYTDEPIAPQLLETIFRAGQAAASSSFVQAYSVIRITNQELRAKIADLSGKQSYIESCPEFLVCCADLARNHTICGGDANPLGEPSYMEQLIIGTVDVSLVAQNMVIAAESEGLGICYIGGIRNNIAQLSTLLNLPKFVYPVFGLCLGYPAQDPEVKPRLPKPLWIMENSYQSEVNTEELETYNDTIREYYKKRTANKKDSNWTEEMRDNFSKKVRPHMQSYLHEQGLGKR